MRQLQKIIASISLTVLTSVSHADSLQLLDQFLRHVQYVQGSFVQVVTSPVKQGESVGRQKTSSGLFAIARPNKFRFEYQKPFEQLMVSDGQTLSVYDADLQQLTQRPLREVMPGTPAVLLTGSSIHELEKLFELKAAPDKDSLQWVEAKPRAKDTTLQRIAMGFAREADGTPYVAAFDVVDSFGQSSSMRLTGVSHKAVPDKQFIYKPKS